MFHLRHNLSCFCFIFPHRLKVIAFVFRRQKTQNQQFQSNSKTAYIFTIIIIFLLKVYAPGRLEMLESFASSSALTQAITLSSFLDNFVHEGDAEGNHLGTTGIEFIHIFSHLATQINEPHSLDSNCSLRAPLFHYQPCKQCLLLAFCC